MQAIALLLLIISIVQAAETDELLITIKGKYSQQSLRVYSEKGRIKCDTENQPPFTLTSNPIKNLKLPASKDIRHSEDCRDSVEILHKGHVLKGCLKDPKIKDVVNELNSVCRY